MSESETQPGQTATDDRGQAPARISRREALRHVTALLGGVAFTGGAGLLAAVLPADAEARQALARERGFTDTDIAWLEEVADTLLPETETPGAKAAATGAFIALMVEDTYTAAEQARFREGMRTLEQWAAEEKGAGFLDLPVDGRLAVLEHFDAEQHAYMADKPDEALAHPFRMFKELCLLGYFTSEIGYRQAQRYQETPGRYDPCVTRDPDDRSWANAL
ncbi:MAG: gluconate 2-dehydrogenase subunit 3 family protein [Xanthomonadales bacterium]|nr:gluconate 2-dehydrogenase subunit 3 family protein [Xanthomonadales bacterium]